MAATNDDLSAFFVIINLPSLANLETLSFNPSIISQFVTLNSQYDLNFNGYSGHGYSITATSDQLSRLQPFFQSANKDFSAVMISTKQKGETYLIIYATELGKMDEFQGIFQNILNSVSFHPLANNITTTTVMTSMAVD